MLRFVFFKLITLIFKKNGRDGKIRTYDPLFPKQVRYQAAPRPDNGGFLTTHDKIEKPKN